MRNCKSFSQAHEENVCVGGMGRFTAQQSKTRLAGDNELSEFRLSIVLLQGVLSDCKIGIGDTLQTASRLSQQI